MNDVIKALEAIEAAPKGTAKLEAIRAGDSNELRAVFRYALSPDVTFGIKKLPEPLPQSERLGGTDGDYAWFMRLGNMLERLAQRQITGHTARDAVSNLLGYCHPLERKWTERILTQDLRMNVGAKDVNRALGQKVVPLFDVPLATDFRKASAKNLTGTFELQPKYDGGRAVAFIPCIRGEQVRLLSRTGKEWRNFESIRATLQAYSDSLSEPKVLSPSGVTVSRGPLFLDGEVVSLDTEGRVNFRMIQKTMLRKDGVEIGRLRYIVFDAGSQDEWFNPGSNYYERLAFAQDVVQEVSVHGNNVSDVSSVRIENPTPESLEGHAAKFMAQGLEGAMLRGADIPVKLGRTKDLLKVKLFVDAEARVVGAVEGTGKYVGMLGALACETLDTKKAFEIGTGFDDQDRAEVWQQHLRGVLPALVTLKFQNLTEDGIPRLPVYKGFRAPEDDPSDSL